MKSVRVVKELLGTEPTSSAVPNATYSRGKTNFPFSFQVLITNDFLVRDENLQFPFSELGTCLAFLL